MSISSYKISVKNLQIFCGNFRSKIMNISYNKFFEIFTLICRFLFYGICMSNGQNIFEFTTILPCCGGGGEIRTLDSLARIAVFKTAALGHYATPPQINITKLYIKLLKIRQNDPSANISRLVRQKRYRYGENPKPLTLLC